MEFLNKIFAKAVDTVLPNAGESFLKMKASGEVVKASLISWNEVTDREIFGRAISGLVPAPGGVGLTRFLREDGTWQEPASSGGGTWGSITGTLSAQTDLQSALNGKVAGSRNISSGTWLTGGGDFTADRTLDVVVGLQSYLNDTQGNPRIYFGDSANTLNSLIFRSANDGGAFRWRTVANTDIWVINGAGTLTLGTVPWARLSDHPTITAGTGLTGGGDLSTGRTINWSTTYGDDRYVRTIGNRQVETTSGDANNMAGKFGTVRTSNTMLNRPESYVTILNIPESTNSDFQLAATYGSSNRLWFRTNADSSGIWRPWEQIYHTGNLDTASFQPAGNYVLRGGAEIGDTLVSDTVGMDSMLTKVGYRSGGVTTPDGNGNYISVAINSSYRYQLFANASNNRFYMRVNNNGTWRTWAQLWHDQNLTPSDYVPWTDVATTGANKVVQYDASGYLRADNWIRIGSGMGLYNTAGHYFFPTTTPYNGWNSRSTSTTHSSTTYQVLDGTAVGAVYADTSGNMGFTVSALNGWRFRVDNVGKATLNDHTTSAGGIRFRAAATAVDLWSNASGQLTTLATINAGTFNATSTSGGGFQGIDADTAGAPSFTWTADLDTGIYRTGANSIGFTTGAAVRARINATEGVWSSTGFLSDRIGLLGTYSSSQVQGVWSIGTAYRIDTGANTFSNAYGMTYAYGTTGGAPQSGVHQILFVNNGSWGVSIGLTGTILAKGDVVAYSSSDIRLKNKRKYITNALDKVMRLGGYSFEWNKLQTTHQGKDIGVIAQEVEMVFPEIVTTRDSGYKAVKYEKLVPVLIEAIKELKREIDSLKKSLN